MKITKKILELVRQRAELDAQIKALEETKREVGGVLLEYMTSQGEEKAEVEVDGKRWALSVQIRKGEEKVEKERLLELGVGIEVIKAATVVGKDSAPFLSVREVKEKGKGKGGTD